LKAILILHFSSDILKEIILFPWLGDYTAKGELFDFINLKNGNVRNGSKFHLDGSKVGQN